MCGAEYLRSIRAQNTDILKIISLLGRLAFDHGPNKGFVSLKRSEPVGWPI